MYGSRDTSEFVDGVFEFCDAALSHHAATGTEGFYCPCVDCGNVGMVSNIGSLREHIFRRGFRQDYHVWVWHGEEGIYDGGNAVVNDVHERGEFDVIENDKNLEDEYEIIEDDDDDDGDHIKEMMEGVDDDAGKRPRIFECMAEASRKSLYPGCTRYTKLMVVITLFNIKTKADISDSAFTSLLQAFGDMLSDDHELPKSNYYAKKLMCAWVGDKKGPPAKVMWYLLIIPRFKRMFSIKKDAKSLRWHGERRKNDGFLKHPVNAPEWKGINRLHKTFGAEDINLRLGLCTDGMNPFDNLSSQHRPKQPGNDIDVYLQPLVDDLRKMWDEGVYVYDAHADEVFTLRVMLLYTLNDFPAYGNLSEYKNKGKKACPNCIDDTESKYISTCHKEVYMRTRRTVEEWVARRPLIGVEVFDQVKSIERYSAKERVMVVRDFGKRSLLCGNFHIGRI
ncbi:uncharacterized protein LOC125492850 [Beta vulgaris subsp. vulgaris]|uniref:uncharacterized protein LOC125492850 n=1 Tax=Beta vulgaris subsp. vulgaris TaxID=3555 RepID=UPI00203762DE|nr:uncharacterized protein LOC125492850 [Beta vulgaris subsp. vulgaris]